LHSLITCTNPKETLAFSTNEAIARKSKYGNWGRMNMGVQTSSLWYFLIALLSIGLWQLAGQIEGAWMGTLCKDPCRRKQSLHP